MMNRKRTYEDDDGRTIVDMSGIGAPSLFVPKRAKKENRRHSEPEQLEPDRPWEDHSMSREERRWYVLGALKASLLIALAFIVGLGLVIALMLLFWAN
jgi:hypothetical protein